MIDQHTVAKSLVINDQDEVLVLIRANGRHRPNSPDLPGGGVDHGEGELIAAVREIYEETGIRVEPMQMRLDYAKTYIYEGRHISATKMLYTCRLDVTPDVRLNPHEHESYAWCPVASLTQMYSFGEFYDEALSYMRTNGLFN